MVSNDLAGSRWLLSGVEVDGARTDCRIAGGKILELAPGLSRDPGERHLDAAGGALLPGLADHHLHLWALAAARASVDLAGASDPADIAIALARVSGSGWLRVIGAGCELRREELDAISASRPVRVQHRSGALWTLNSVALERLSGGLDAAERASGQLWRADTRLRALLAGAGASPPPDLTSVGDELAAWGVTHLTDATADLTSDSLQLLHDALPQRIGSLGPAGTGPLKLILADHDLPDPDELTGQIRLAHASGRPVAMHVVSAVTLVLACMALEAAGAWPHDRIEHAAVCDDRMADRLAGLAVTVVTQPSMWTRYGAQYLHDSAPDERPLLWRYGSLLARGVSVAVSSDAPYGDPDPWHTIHSAVGRELADGTIGGLDERVSPQVALASLLADPVDPVGPARTVQVGAPADLALLDRPLSAALDDAAGSGESGVRATFVDGRAIWIR